MTIITLRNAVVKLLWQYLGVPVILSDQVQPEAEPPFGIYTVTTPYASTGELGEYSKEDAEDGGLLEHRREMPSATFPSPFAARTEPARTARRSAAQTRRRSWPRRRPVISCIPGTTPS